MDVFSFIMKETARKGKKKKMDHDIPVVSCEIADLAKKTEEMEDRGPNSAPVLYIFFDKNNKFALAEVAADNQVIHLCAANLCKAVIAFLGVYYVFHVGYAPVHESFLTFLQAAFLGEDKFDPKVNIAVKQFLERFRDALANEKSLTPFKKLCY